MAHRRVATGVLFLLWLFAWAAMWGYRDEIASALVPTSWWLQVRDVQVRSVSTVDDDPRVLIDRTVSRDVYLDRVVTLRPVSGEGHGECTRIVRHIPLAAGASFPATPPTLREMQGTPPESECGLLPGGHVVDITWRWPVLDGLLVISQTRSSNIFYVGQMPGQP